MKGRSLSGTDALHTVVHYWTRSFSLLALFPSKRLYI